MLAWSIDLLMFTLAYLSTGKKCCAVILLVTGWACVAAPATVVTQEIEIHSGWNAVYLQLQPEPADCNSIFNSLGEIEVWTPDHALHAPCFTADEAICNTNEWRYWRSGEADSGSNMDLQAGRPYLIRKVSLGDTTLTLTGSPRAVETRWSSDGENFVGVPVDASGRATYESYFYPSEAHARQPVYRLLPVGRWYVADPATPIHPGEAFWVHCRGSSTFKGPLAVETDGPTGLDYGGTIVELELSIRNLIASSCVVTVHAIRPSSTGAGWAPTTNCAGTVPLSWLDASATNSIAGVWREVFTTNAPALELALEPNEKRRIRMAVRRADLEEFDTTPDRPAHYRCTLVVSNTFGTVASIAVHCQGLSLPRQRGSINPAHVGLWVGEAVIDHVSQGESQETTSVGIADGFPLTVIWHLDSSGVARLLPGAVLMWTNGHQRAGGLSGGDDQFSGKVLLYVAKLPMPTDSLRGIQRFTAAWMTGEVPESMLVPGNQLNSRSIRLNHPRDDAHNPFRHAYHKEHSAAEQDVKRNITMTFDLDSARTSQVPGWGDDVVGGSWREEVEGLRKTKIVAQGLFRLRRVSAVGSIEP